MGALLTNAERTGWTDKPRRRNNLPRPLSAPMRGHSMETSLPYIGTRLCRVPSPHTNQRTNLSASLRQGRLVSLLLDLEAHSKGNNTLSRGRSSMCYPTLGVKEKEKNERTRMLFMWYEGYGVQRPIC